MAGFQNGALVPGSPQLIGRGHSRQTRAENYDRYVFAVVTGKRGRSLIGLRRCQQPQGLHHEIGRPVATGGAHAREQLAAGQAWLNPHLLWMWAKHFSGTGLNLPDSPIFGFFHTSRKVEVFLWSK